MGAGDVGPVSEGDTGTPRPPPSSLTPPPPSLSSSNAYGGSSSFSKPEAVTVQRYNTHHVYDQPAARL